MRTGRHFLQIPGPTNVPDRVLRAIDQPIIDHRGPEFAKLTLRVLDGMKRIVKTRDGRVVIYPASGTGAWEAALVNTLSPGDQVLMVEIGQFASLWRVLAERIGLDPVVIQSNWRTGVDPETLGSALSEHPSVKAVCVVHNETSTGCASRVAEIRQAMDAVGSDALLMVDTVSSLASTDVRMDDWGIDVVVGGSQKGLMLPPRPRLHRDQREGVGGEQERAASPLLLGLVRHARPQRERASFPTRRRPTSSTAWRRRSRCWRRRASTPCSRATHAMPRRPGERCAAGAWEILCEEPKDYSNTGTAVLMPEGHSADALRALILERFDMALGTGLARLADKVFRIGHLGAMNDLMLMGTLSGVEMGLALADVPHQANGTRAAMDYLTETADDQVRIAA